MIAQGLWGRGNASPLDMIFGGTVLVKFAPLAGFGFIGCQLGQKLRKYADDTGIRVDAVESDPAITQLCATRRSSIETSTWNQDETSFKKNRYQTFVVLQASALVAPLETVYSKAAAALKIGGKLFAGDLMKCNGTGIDGQPQAAIVSLDVQTLHLCNEHISALEAVGLKIESRLDLTAEFLAAVRSGFFKSIKLLEELQECDETDTRRRMATLAVQIATWKRIYYLAVERKLEVIGFVATRVM